MCGPRWLRWSENEPLYDAPWIRVDTCIETPRLILSASSPPTYTPHIALIHPEHTQRPRSTDKLDLWKTITRRLT